MSDDHDNLKRKLVEETRRFEQETDVEEKDLLGADVRELERLVEIEADKDPDSPIEPSRHLKRDL
jgi:hypothetical protein